jgi:hypothetical protein
MPSVFCACREQVEEQLRIELLKAEADLLQAAPENRQQALSQYRRALFRFTRLVIDDQLPENLGQES